MAEQEAQPEEVEDKPEEAQEQPAEEAPVDEAPVEEPAAAEPEEELKEEPPQEEAPAESPKPKKKGKKKRKKKKKGGNPAEVAWQKISAKNQSEINWYLMKLDGKVGSTSDLVLVEEGNGGAAEIVQFLKDKKKEIMFGLLMCVTTDSANSVRGKFIYLRVVGSGVGVMSKARLTPSLGKIDDHFPCKHLTLDVTDDCAAELAPEKIATELLRVGGAHKPDKMSFGPDQDVDVKSL